MKEPPWVEIRYFHLTANRHRHTHTHTRLTTLSCISEAWTSFMKPLFCCHYSVGWLLVKKKAKKKKDSGLKKVFVECENILETTPPTTPSVSTSGEGRAFLGLLSAIFWQLIKKDDKDCMAVIWQWKIKDERGNYVSINMLHPGLSEFTCINIIPHGIIVCVAILCS